MATLPDIPFDEIAVELLGAARGAREAVTAAEILDARGLAAGGLRHTMAELNTRAMTLGALYTFFREVAPREEAIRDLLAALDAPDLPEALHDRRTA